MTEEAGEDIMNRTSAVGMATAPFLIGMKLQQQWLHAAREMNQAMLQIHPWFRKVTK